MSWPWPPAMPVMRIFSPGRAPAWGPAGPGPTAAASRAGVPRAARRPGVSVEPRVMSLGGLCRGGGCGSSRRRAGGRAPDRRGRAVAVTLTGAGPRCGFTAWTFTRAAHCSMWSGRGDPVEREDRRVRAVGLRSIDGVVTAKPMAPGHALLSSGDGSSSRNGQAMPFGSESPRRTSALNTDSHRSARA